MAHTVCVIPGDGIGPEVTDAARRLIDTAGADIEWIEVPAGARAYDIHGDVLPRRTLETIEHYRLALKGPVTTPIGKGFANVNVQLRKRLNLYAAVRQGPRSLPRHSSRGCSACCEDNVSD